MLFFSWKAAHQFWCLFQKTLWFFFTSYSLCTSQLALCNSWGRRDQRHADCKEEGKHKQPTELGAALCKQKRRAGGVRSAWGCSPQAWSRAGSTDLGTLCCWRVPHFLAEAFSSGPSGALFPLSAALPGTQGHCPPRGHRPPNRVLLGSLCAGGTGAC